MKILMRGPGVAAGITALLAALLLAGCSSPGASSAAGAGGSVTSGASGSPSGAPTTPAAGTAPTSAVPASAPATGPVTTSAGGPVPAKFAATSVTFVSADEAFVLGTAPCSVKPCTSIVRTLNRGATWVGLPAPVVPLGSPYSSTAQSAVWGIRFADPSVGFVFGQGIWETTDGGERWAAIDGPGKSIVDLEVIDSQVLALTDACTADGCSQSEFLYRRALDGGPWHFVTTVGSTRAIATQARVAAVLDGNNVVVSADGGLTFATRAASCGGADWSGSSVAVTGPDSLALYCAGGAAAGSVQKELYVSNDLGEHWSKAGTPPFGGDPWGISAGTPAQIVVGAASGASWLYYSGDGGARWSTAYQAPNAGAGFNDIGFTTTTDGVAVSGPAYTDGNTEGMPGQLLLTSNGGASWQAVTW